MRNGLHPSRASASSGSSRTLSQARKQQKTVQHCSSDNQCDIHGCSSCFGRKSDLDSHKESLRSQKRHCPFDHCGYVTEEVDQMTEHMRNPHGVPSPNAQTYQSSIDSQYHHSYTTERQDIFTSTDREDIDGLSNLDRINCYEYSTSSEIQSSYDTSCFSFASSLNSDDSHSLMSPYANMTAYLNGIGHWVDDHSSSGFTWTAWQNSDVLLQHASRCRVASSMLKPHVEEAMNCFQASFYGIGGAAAE